jgi:hypothetical protein
MEGFTNGTFGPGSIKPFAAPTAAEAAATPGYQFTKAEGNRGVSAAASAGGRSLSGGTLRALDRYNTGLADSTYGDTFSRALQSYQAQLAGQSQSYNELAGVAGTGQTATQSLNNTGTATAANVGNLMSQIGSAQAGGILGSANSINSGIGGATNGITQALLLQSLYGSGGAFGAPTNINSMGGLGANPLPLPPQPPDLPEYPVIGPG